MIAETLAGIALVKSAVEGIKGAINTAKDISEIASHVDNLLEGEQQIQKKRSKQSGMGISDQLGIRNVAQEVIDARLAQEQIHEMRNLIDLRFGHGTWQSIVDLRAKRIQEAKEREREERKQRIKEHNEFVENMKGVGLAAVVVVLMLIAFIGIFAIQ